MSTTAVYCIKSGHHQHVHTNLKCFHDYASYCGQDNSPKPLPAETHVLLQTAQCKACKNDSTVLLKQMQFHVFIYNIFS